MKLSIEYCATCNYRPIAAALAREIEQETGVKAELIHSYVAGSFEITLRGNRLFSKLKTNRFPDSKEVIALIKEQESLDGD